MKWALGKARRVGSLSYRLYGITRTQSFRTVWFRRIPTSEKLSDPQVLWQTMALVVLTLLVKIGIDIVLEMHRNMNSIIGR